MKIKDDTGSFGKAFLELRLSDMITRVNELDNKTLKEELIWEDYNDQIGTYDRELE